MLTFNQYQIEVWPGIVRIHHKYDTKKQQTIELTVEQIPAFTEHLKALAAEADALGKEFQALETKKNKRV